MSSHLQRGRVDVSLIQKTARNDFINLLEKCPGSKVVVWDEYLVGPMNLIIQNLLLSKHLVEKTYLLGSTSLLETTVDHVIFISRPKLQLMDHIAHSIKNDSEHDESSKKKYHVFFVPKKSVVCQEALQLKLDFGYTRIPVGIQEFACHLFPFDSDVISMETPEIFSEYKLENDPTHIYHIAQALIFLQELYGPILRIWGKGPAAKEVWNLVEILQDNTSNKKPESNQASSFDQILLIDRSIDLISPLATQLTYEGLIDEIFGINNSTAHLPIDKNNGNTQVLLDSTVDLFFNIRDKNFNAVPKYLSEKAKSISSQIEDPNKKSVAELKVYVEKLSHITTRKAELELHTSIAECIKNYTENNCEFWDNLKTEQEFLNCFEVDKANPYIEELISQGKPLVQVLRLMCLQSLCASGLKQKVIDRYKKELLQVYGLEVLFAITKLEKVGLLKLQSGSMDQYTTLHEMLKLVIMEGISEIDPSDICYVHSIYAPLSVRLVEYVTKNGGSKQLQDALQILPGPTIDESLSGLPSLIQIPDAPKVILVFFIGGCTFAEISALRFLSQQEDSNVEFVIATTKLIKGTTFLKSIIETYCHV